MAPDSDKGYGGMTARRNRTCSVNERIMGKEIDIRPTSRRRVNSLTQLRRKKTAPKLKVDPNQQLIHDMLRVKSDISE